MKTDLRGFDRPPARRWLLRANGKRAALGGSDLACCSPKCMAAAIGPPFKLGDVRCKRCGVIVSIRARP